jgi:multicomponent Na+:H+ antiporter subunit E
LGEDVTGQKRLFHATIHSVTGHRGSRADAEAILRALPKALAAATPACPLCGAATTARGLRPRQLAGTHQTVWELAFTCPACGLTTAFDFNRLPPERIASLVGSRWANELRQARWLGLPADLPQTRNVTTRNFLSVLVISFLTWLVLTGSFQPVDLLWGLAVCLVVARLSYRLVAFELPHWVMHPRRWLYFTDLLWEFTRQIVAQNVSLSLRVLRPRLAIRPGIVAVPFRIRGDVNITLLGSLMSLTPDTVTIDIDLTRSVMYVHWIDVKSTDPNEMRQLISADLEDRLIRWLL